MVFLACHHIEGNPRPRLVHNIHQILNQTLKNKNILCQADIINTLGRVGAKSGSHAAG